jgi:hypothetical protein
MKKLGVRVGSGIGITHDWTDQELIDIFTADPGSAIEYEQVIETLKEERRRVQVELDSLKSRRVKGISPALDHLMLLSRILFFRIWVLERFNQNNENASEGPRMPSDAFPENYSISDLQKRYSVKSPQGMVEWLKRNLQKINSASSVPVQKIGKYWQIPGEALLVIDGLRRKRPENHKLPSAKI